MKFRDIRYTEGGGAELIERDIADPGPGEVQVENTACGICSFDMHAFKTGFAAQAGHEGVGYVTKLGPGVESMEVGQRVCGGGFGRLRNVSPGSLYKIPDSNLADHHWIVEPVSCCVTGIDHCQLKAGERIAMVGCGFMGLIMLQMLKGMNADQVIALDVDDRRLELSMELGATEAHNVTGEDFDDIKRDLRSRGIDVVTDTSGAQNGLDLATDIVKVGGRINLFGWIKGTEATFNPSTWHGKGITIVNSSPLANIRDPFPPAIRVIQNGVVDLKPLVTHVVPVAEFPDFMEDVVKGEVGDYLKGVVTMG